MSIRSIRFTLTIAALIFIYGAAWQAGYLRAQADPPDPNRQYFGMVGLARGQTARLNVVYLPPVDPDRPACSSDHFIATVEVFGPNVATSLLYPGPAFVPPIDPDMPAPR